MTHKPDGAGARACWFVGSSFSGTEDQTPRFLKEGIWETDHLDEKVLAKVRSIKPGDRIAIKSAYVRKNTLPFDNRGQTVSVMAIKAIGTVTENLGDGRSLKVDWKSFDPPREWYFYTHRSTVWNPLLSPAQNEFAEALIRFTFEDEEQDIDWFRNAPYWRERFGDRFNWTPFYEAIANQLLTFRNRRDELVAGIHAIAEKVDCMSILNDQFEENIPGGPLLDICPFTTMGIFNRGITDANRKIIARELASLLGVAEPVPESFEGVPVLNNQRTWFFGYSYRRQPNDIDVLWEIFAQAITFAESGDSENLPAFISAYDNATQCWGVGWNLTMGLYWIRPWKFLPLDSQSLHYINKKLNIQIAMNGPKGRCNANDYLEAMETLEMRFQEDAFTVHSFPELSLAAWQYRPIEIDGPNWRNSMVQKIKQMCEEKGSSEFTRKEFMARFLAEIEEEFPKNNTIESTINRQFQVLRDDDLLEFSSRGVYRWLDNNDKERPVVSLESYCIDDIISEGCFIAREKIEKILERLRTKKNLILQGSPGTGKTWLAKRLAFALIGERADDKVRAVQFHPNLSYEDFIRGWRPAGEGKLTLVDGPFMEMIEISRNDASSKYVVVIEEINRGNPAQIFGEMLTLLEGDKRTPNEALELSYKRDDERVFIPGNLYVIGTMNIADRSLALVDLALRRRFAFIDLEPTLGKPWHDWVQSKCGIDSEILGEIEKRILALNSDITADAGLGPQFQVGHSYVTPPFGIPIKDAREWFRQVVDTEIGPLLDEYWFDDLEKSRKARERLLAGF
mgnify:CR=1 FL=1